MPELMDRISNAIEAAGAFRNCTNCFHWQSIPNELCKLYKERPPASVIVNGCDEFDEIPF